MLIARHLAASKFAILRQTGLMAVDTISGNPWQWPNRGSIEHFTRSILAWGRRNYRQMPWAEEKDPFRVWLSEVILQQTTVRQGEPYYLKFRDAFPNVNSLAQCSEDRLLRLWQGLGYYTRARNMLKAAKQVVRDDKGNFPVEYDDLLKLPGVGPYTAAAVASLSGGQPKAVVDGNVIRVLCRYFGVSEPIGYARAKRILAELADALLPQKSPGPYNQALMNFGAAQCRPSKPACDKCPLRSTCVAYRTGKVSELPVKRQGPPKRVRHFSYLVVRVNGSFILKKRTQSDIWRGLYEFPMIESENTPLIRSSDTWRSLFHSNKKLPSKAVIYKQQLSHQVVNGRFFELTGRRVPEDCLAIQPAKLSRFPFPRIISWYLEERGLS